MKAVKNIKRNGGFRGLCPLTILLILLLCGCSKRYSGSIRKSVVWRGKIKLTGDVVVERRGSLKILPGTKIFSSPKPENQVRYIREEAGGTFNILQNEKVEILVEGNFEALGTEEKPIVFEENF